MRTVYPAVKNWASTIRGASKNASIIGVGTAVPPRRFTQEEALQYILNNFTLRDGTRRLYERVFSNKSVRTRYFAGESFDEAKTMNRDEIIERFTRWAVRLSAESVEKALKDAAVLPSEVDFIAATTCTGYLCPGISSYLVETLGLRKDVHQADIVGMGCGAAIPAMEQASNFVKSNPGATAVVVSTEICSAAFISKESPDIVVSNALFGDGSGAMVLRGGISPHTQNGYGPYPVAMAFESRIYPEWREGLRFKTEDGYLRNVLDKEVPQRAALGMRELAESLLGKARLKKEDISHWIVHAGGQKILDGLAASLEIPPETLKPSYSVLENYGNLSSPSVIFVLDASRKTRTPRPGEWGVMASFGAGFSAFGALLRF